MRTRAIALAAAGLAVTVGLAFAQPAPQPTPLAGYLSPDRAPDTIAILPPSPGAQTPIGRADRAIFRATRAQQGSARWALAHDDSQDQIDAMLRHFSCAAGVALTPENAPRTAALFAKLRADDRRAVDRPKDLYKRPRPYMIDKGPICVARTNDLTKTPDYPSGHATWGWAWGLVLAELIPDRATPILIRARAFGESRVVCGVHNVSAIEVGRDDASVLVAALHGDAAFRADLDGARAELASLRASHPPQPAACDAEAALIARTPW
ncbi:MAG: phosphatase PAP2 family protein [Caulobacterales bacterium]